MSKANTTSRKQPRAAPAGGVVLRGDAEFKLIALLDQLERTFMTSAGPILPDGVVDRAVTRARARAAAVQGAEGERLALLGFARELLLVIVCELSGHLPDLCELIADCERVGISRLELGREVLRDEHLLELPREDALSGMLSLLVFFAGLDAVSLWQLSPTSSLSALAYAGVFDPNALATRNLARRLLGDASAEERDERGLQGHQIPRWRQPPAALVLRGQAAGSLPAQELVEAAMPVLIGLLEREQAAASGRISQKDVLTSAERRLTRMRFDLHDGPQQDILLLAEDLGLFRAQLEGVVEGNPDAHRIVGRVDDLQARLVALDGDIRRISSTLQSPFLQQESLTEALSQLAATFTARTGIEPRVEYRGHLGQLTDSQQITLLGLLRESLNNIREHSEAESVSIVICGTADGIEATVTDDGRGFDPEETLIAAARGGHLGLVGMHERVRLLGGSTQIDSRPGGPTVISVKLPNAPEGVPTREAS